MILSRILQFGMKRGKRTIPLVKAKKIYKILAPLQPSELRWIEWHTYYKRRGYEITNPNKVHMNGEYSFPSIPMNNRFHTFKLALLDLNVKYIH
jgi:hypothetical protein